MKKTILSLMAAFAMMSGGATEGNAQTQKTELNVSGKCGMCKTRIEQTAKSVSGVKTAVYDLKKNKLLVDYDKSATNINKISEALAAKGHDAGAYKADGKVYDQLPGCCKYRK